MKRVMIVGASAGQVPLIKRAKELGYCVAALDYDGNAAGIPYADKFYKVSTIDPEGVCTAAKEFKADGITTVATDMPMRAIAYTCEQLGLSGIDSAVALKATDKVEMIKAFESCNVPHPWFFVVKERNISEVKGKLSFPCICKPIDNSASRGVMLINSEAELTSAIDYSAKNGRSGDVIIEELLVGSEISVEAFAVNGNVHILAITDKITTGAPHFVEIGHNQPSKFVGKDREAIVDATKKAMAAIGIENGPAHVEMMVTQNGPRLIELGARLGGDFITTDLVPLSTGIDMLGATIKLACGEAVDLEPKFAMASAIRFMKTKTGIITGVENVDKANSIPGVWRVEMLTPIGMKVVELKNSLDRVGYAISQAKTVEEAGDLCRKALNTVKVVVEEDAV